MIYIKSCIATSKGSWVISFLSSIFFVLPDGNYGSFRVSRPETIGPESVRFEPIRLELVRPKSNDSIQRELVRIDPSSTTETGWPESVRLQAVGSVAIRPQPERTVPLRPEPMRSKPVRFEPVRSEPLRSEPLRPEPVRSEPVRPEPGRPNSGNSFKVYQQLCCKSKVYSLEE